jgi:hypothetical protein
LLKKNETSHNISRVEEKVGHENEVDNGTTEQHQHGEGDGHQLALGAPKVGAHVGELGPVWVHREVYGKTLFSGKRKKSLPIKNDFFL